MKDLGFGFWIFFVCLFVLNFILQDGSYQAYTLRQLDRQQTKIHLKELRESLSTSMSYSERIHNNLRICNIKF